MSRDQLAAEYAAGATMVEVSRKFGLSMWRIRRIFSKAGIKRRPSASARASDPERPADWYVAERQRYIARTGGRAADCHAQRRAFVGSLCRHCYQARPTPLIGLEMVPGAQQQAGETLPTECPKCGSGEPTWQMQERYARCFMCGADRFLIPRQTLT